MLRVDGDKIECTGQILDIMSEITTVIKALKNALSKDKTGQKMWESFWEVLEKEVEE